MYLNILTKEQQELIPLISQFRREYYLVGGTAIALQIGHRKSMAWDKIITMPTLLDLAAMKAYALGRRAKWKDYVDLYFLLTKYCSYQSIVGRTKEIFEGDFNEKLFREQLSYFEDVSYEEEVEYCRDEISDEVIKAFLMNLSTATF